MFKLTPREENEWAFVIGCANFAGTAWIMGFAPWCMWIWHLIKMTVVLGHRFYSFGMKKMQFFMLDYCYTINYWSFIYYIICITKVVPSANAAVVGPIFFRLAFTAVTGPLAMSILAFRNSLVFHDIGQIGILAVHWSPSMAVWGMRWFPNKLEAAFPGMFHIGCDSQSHEYTLFFHDDNCAGTFVQLWCYPVLHYILLWSIPYALFVFVFGRRMLEEEGYHTVYSEMKDKEPMKGLLEKLPGGPEYAPAKYMFVHGCAASLAFLLGPLMWHSFILHTLYLLALFTVMCRNGASYYFRVFPKLLEKEKVKEREQELQALMAEGAGTGTGKGDMMIIPAVIGDGDGDGDINMADAARAGSGVSNTDK